MSRGLRQRGLRSRKDGGAYLDILTVRITAVIPRTGLAYMRSLQLVGRCSSIHGINVASELLRPAFEQKLFLLGS